MITFDTDPSIKWLFCMTHPDDEIFIASWIKRLTQQKHQVYLSWTHDTPTRLKEAIHAAKLLGVPEENLYFHHGSDGAIVDEIPSLINSFQSMIQKISPDRIACGAFEQGHIDHDATNFMVNTIFQGPVFEIPFYHSYTTKFPSINNFSDSNSGKHITLTKAEKHFKYLLLKQYPSQRILRNIIAHEILQLISFKSAKFFRIESMRLQTHKNFIVPNHPQKNHAKILKSPIWKRWVSTISHFI